MLNFKCLIIIFISIITKFNVLAVFLANGTILNETKWINKISSYNEFQRIFKWLQKDIAYHSGTDPYKLINYPIKIKNITIGHITIDDAKNPIKIVLKLLDLIHLWLIEAYKSTLNTKFYSLLDTMLNLKQCLNDLQNDFKSKFTS